MTELLKFFKTPEEFRRWLTDNHAKVSELWVGFYKVDSGRPSITWKESVDQALCFGWIDGLRKSIDDKSYKIRFTPRKSTSNWSKVNIKRYGELLEQGLIQPAGKKVYEATATRRRNYSYEQEQRALSEEYLDIFRKKKRAWKYFSEQAPWYQRTSSYWVMSAKKEETRLRRLAQLIADSEQGKRLGLIAGKDPGKK